MHPEEGNCPFRGNREGTSAALACCDWDHRPTQAVEQCCAGGSAVVGEGVEREVGPSLVASGLDLEVADAGGFVWAVEDCQYASHAVVVDHVGKLDHRKIREVVEGEPDVEPHCVLVMLPPYAFLALAPASVVAFDDLQSAEVAFSRELVLFVAVLVLPSSDS